MTTFIIIIIVLACIISFQLYAYFQLKSELKDREYKITSLLDEINSVEYIEKKRDKEQMDAYFKYITQMENEEFKKETYEKDYSYSKRNPRSL